MFLLAGMPGKHLAYYCTLPTLQQSIAKGHRLSLTSVKEGNFVFLPPTLNSSVRRGKLGIYTFQKTPEVFCKFAPPGGYKECGVVYYA